MCQPAPPSDSEQFDMAQTKFPIEKTRNPFQNEKWSFKDAETSFRDSVTDRFCANSHKFVDTMPSPRTVEPLEEVAHYSTQPLCDTTCNHAELEALLLGNKIAIARLGEECRRSFALSVASVIVVVVVGVVALRK